MLRHVIAIDIGGTKIAGALFRFASPDEVRQSTDSQGVQAPVTGASGLVIESGWTAATAKTGGNDVAATVVTVAQKILEYAASKDIKPLGIGIGSAGVVDTAGRKIVSATDAIPGWGGTPLADIVETRTNLPVLIENDVHAHARGEATAGSGSGCDSTLMVAIGTGIGGALTQGDEILRGVHGLAGHVGHIFAPGAQGNICSCGCDGHLEAIASGPGMTRWFNTRGGEAKDARDLEQQALAGDQLAITVMAEAATATGQIIAGLVNAFDPQVAILGGGLARAGQLYWAPLRAAYEQQLMPALTDTPLMPATLGAEAALVGAGELIRSYIEKTLHI